MIANGVEILERCEIKGFVIVSSDKDYLPVMRIASYKNVKFYINSWIKKITSGKLDSAKKIQLIQRRDLTGEKLLLKLKNELHRKVLLNFLQRYDVHEVKSDKELKSYINKDDDRAVLLKKLQNY